MYLSTGHAVKAFYFFFLCVPVQFLFFNILERTNQYYYLFLLRCSPALGKIFFIAVYFGFTMFDIHCSVFINICIINRSMCKQNLGKERKQMEKVRLVILTS